MPRSSKPNLIQTVMKENLASVGPPAAACPAPSRFWQAAMGQQPWTVAEQQHLHTCRACATYLSRVGDAVAAYRSGVVPGWWALASRLWEVGLERVCEAAQRLTLPTAAVEFADPAGAATERTEPAPELELRFAADPDLTAVLYREPTDAARWLSLAHARLAPGTLLQVRLHGTGAQGLGRWVMLRKGHTRAAARLRVEEALAQVADGRLQVGLAPSPDAFGPTDSAGLRSAYRLAGEQDPASVRPLDGPRSAWQLWADGVLAAPGVCPEVRQVAAAIAQHHDQGGNGVA